VKGVAVNLVRRFAGIALAAGALLLAGVVPASASAPAPDRQAAAATAAAVGPVQLVIPGFGSGPDNVAYQMAFTTAYNQAASYGFSSGQCQVTLGPLHLLELPSGFGEWGLEITCKGEPAVTSSTRNLTRYNDGKTDHRTTTWNVPSGFSQEAVLGKLYGPALGHQPAVHVPDRQGHLHLPAGRLRRPEVPDPAGLDLRGQAVGRVHPADQALQGARQL
jgi:hypothetical protein